MKKVFRSRGRPIFKKLSIIGILVFGALFILPVFQTKETEVAANMITREYILERPSFYNMDPKEGLWEAMEYYGILFPEIVYAQAQLETGHFKSSLCINSNNLFGLYNSREKKYYRFTHWAESVEAYKNKIQNRYRPGEDYYAFLNRIHYAGSSAYIPILKKIVKKNGKVKQNASPGYNKQTGQRVQTPEEEHN